MVQSFQPRLAVTVAALGVALLGFSSASLGAGSSYHLYGPGTPGNGGVTPRIFAFGSAFPGSSSFGLEVDEALGGSSATLMIGAAPLDQTTAGFHLSVFPLILLPGVQLSGSPGAAGAGEVMLQLPIPALPTLQGFDAYFQCAVNDPGAAFGLSATEGLRVNIGEPPLVMAVSSVFGGTDPVVSVDPVSQVATDWTGTVSLDGVVDVVFSPDGGSAMLAATLSKRFQLFDVVAGTPAFQVIVAGAPNCSAFTPDGKRAYVASGGNGISSVIEIDCDPSSPSYGTQVGQVSGFLLGQSQWEGIAVSGDGKTLTIANLGLGNPPGLAIVDIDPSSPTKNQVKHWVAFGGFVTDAEPNHDGSLIFASVAYLSSSQGDVFVIDGEVGQIISVVPNVGTFPTDIDIDGRGDYALVACPNSATIARVGVNQNAPGYLQSSSLYVGGEPFALALSPDGRKCYVGFSNGTALTEVDVINLTATQSLPLPASAGVGVAAR